MTVAVIGGGTQAIGQWLGMQPLCFKIDAWVMLVLAVLCTVAWQLHDPAGLPASGPGPFLPRSAEGHDEPND
jgi:hypothetical protein